MSENNDPAQKLYLCHTKREWDTIYKRLADLGKKNLSAYIMGQIKLLDLQYSEDKDKVIKSLPKRSQRPILIYESYLKTIGVISLKTNVPVATIIDKFIIEPLMMPLD